jgi:hypothetical protein
MRYVRYEDETGHSPAPDPIGFGTQGENQTRGEAHGRDRFGNYPFRDHQPAPAHRIGAHHSHSLSMIAETFSFYGIEAAIAEINRRNAPTAFDNAETRLGEKMKPARLAPLNTLRSPDCIARGNPASPVLLRDAGHSSAGAAINL